MRFPISPKRLILLLPSLLSRRGCRDVKGSGVGNLKSYVGFIPFVDVEAEIIPQELPQGHGCFSSAVRWACHASVYPQVHGMGSDHTPCVIIRQSFS